MDADTEQKTTMLRKASDLEHYTIKATDGDLGKVKDFYFSDTDWVVRYLVADTGHWLPGRRVLLSTDVFDQPLWLTNVFPVKLTCREVRESPDVSEHLPVNRRHELDLMAHYNWPVYWDMASYPLVSPIAVPIDRTEAAEGEDVHLNSVNALKGCHIHTSDDVDVGRAHDIVIEDGSWAIRYMAVDIGHIITRKKVLISPHWIESIELANERIVLDIDATAVRHSPHWDPIAPLNREYERVLFEHYGRPKYWI